MRSIVHSLTAALSLGGLALSLAVASTTGALAQAKQAPPARQAAPAPQAAPPAAPPLKQIALTEKQIEGVLASEKEMDAITEKLPPDARPDPKITAQLEGVARKYGFAGYDDYSVVVDNVSLVLGGFDPQTKKYIGPEAVLKAQIAAVQADKKMPAKDKKAALADLNDQLKSPPPTIENKGNIDLVSKYYDKLADALLAE
jgi:hypothetical protein